MMKHSLCVVALFLCTFIIGSLSQPQTIPTSDIPPPEVIASSASRMSRLHHNLFHNIRMNWPLLDEIEQREIENLGWKPLFISFTYINGNINQPVMIMGPTGEDFLWMHKRMIKKVDEIAANASSTWRVGWGWLGCPLPTSTEWPVPPVPTTIVDNIPSYAEYLSYYKTDEFYNNEILPREIKMNETAFLRSLTLGEFGTLIEYELHTYFHVRFAAYNPVGYRIQSLHPTAYVDPMWDDPQYDYLADFYSAHANPTFWKIHGWIERVVHDWASAHGINYPNQTLPWTSTWENGPMEENILLALEQVARDAEARANGTVSTKSDSDNDAGEIVGAIIGSIVLIIIILIIGYVYMSKILAQTKAKVQPSNIGDGIPLKNDISDNTYPL